MYQVAEKDLSFFCKILKPVESHQFEYQKETRKIRWISEKKYWGDVVSIIFIKTININDIVFIFIWQIRRTFCTDMIFIFVIFPCSLLILLFSYYIILYRITISRVTIFMHFTSRIESFYFYYWGWIQQRERYYGYYFRSVLVAPEYFPTRVSKTTIPCPLCFHCQMLSKRNPRREHRHSPSLSLPLSLAASRTSTYRWQPVASVRLKRTLAAAGCL